MENMKLTFVNVGYGEAMVLECPDNSFADNTFVMVIDGGSAEEKEYDGSNTGRVQMETYLSRHGINHVDVMVATHVHEDHLCGLLPVESRYRPNEFWQTLPEGFSNEIRRLQLPEEGLTASRCKLIHALNDYKSLCDSLRGHGSRQLALTAGKVLRPCKNLTVRTLGPSQSRIQQMQKMFRELYQNGNEEVFWRRLDQLDAAMNNFSLVIMLDYLGTRILLPGDTTSAGYGNIAIEDLRADLFKLGHHGQKDGISQSQIQKIAPKAVVCCASSDRRYDSAEPKTLKMIADAGADLYFSDCPPVQGGTPPPHQALIFTIGSGGSVQGDYEC